jgi:hypothetical protein
MSEPYTGKCLCGKVSYQVDEIQPKMAHCHCTMCRKFHGAAFSTYGEARAEHFHWLTGEHLLKNYIADNGTIRRFCGACGSSLTFAPSHDSGEFIEFSLGSLDTDIPLKPDIHVFVDNKATWYDITDTRPQCKGPRE